MRYFVHIDTGMGRIEDHSGSDFRDLRTATKVAIEQARDFLLEHLGRCPLMGYELFVEISHESGDLLSLLTPRKLLFGATITDRHRRLCDLIPHPWLRLNRDLAIQDANPRYLCATFTDRDLISGRNMFDAFPDNPNDLEADGVRNLSSSLREVLRTRRPHRMALQRYDVRGRSGRWFRRYWEPINVPVLDHNGEVAAIIHHVEDRSGKLAPTRN